ncbi:serine hydrolase domain-containing protein [Erwinia rhapontici]|uniref:serine hydrolase domain-containing protein n=1 Tax=Erwinia rhapontici TaxID=55212 RepID=UPI003B9FE84B
MTNLLFNSPGAIALMQFDDGRAIEFRMGVEDTLTGVPINKNSIFDLASVSKQFTAFSILILEKSGLLNLNDHLSDYIPEVAFFSDNITIENLIYHTSGLPCLFDVAEDKKISYYSPFSHEDIIKGICERGNLKFTPGTRHEYSNTGYIFLAQVVKKASGLSFPDFVKKEIFAPLDMNNSFVFDGLSMDKGTVNGYQKNDNDIFVPVYSPWEVTGAGLVHSSVSDLMKWGQNFSSGLVGGKELIRKMLTPLPLTNDTNIMIEDHNSYCFGIELDEDKSGRIYCHQGSTFGRETYFVRSQDAAYTLAVLSNIEGYDVCSMAVRLYNGMTSIAA